MKKLHLVDEQMVLLADDLVKAILKLDVDWVNIPSVKAAVENYSDYRKELLG